MGQEIKFGTDGWRGIIADDFTFENIRRVAGAIASYVLKYEDPKRGVIVGYDARFASPKAARVVADIISAAGIPVKLANDYTPTPAVSYGVKHEGAAGGVMVTSSHNPWNWNGVKFKGKFGGSATPGIMKRIEEELAAGAAPKGNKATVRNLISRKITLSQYAPSPIWISSRRLSLNLRWMPCTAPAGGFCLGSSRIAAYTVWRSGRNLIPFFQESTLSQSSRIPRCCRTRWF